MTTMLLPRQIQGATKGDIMGLAITDCDETRQLTVIIKVDVDFQGPFGLPELSSGEDRQAEGYTL